MFQSMLEKYRVLLGVEITVLGSGVDMVPETPVSIAILVRRMKW